MVRLNKLRKRRPRRGRRAAGMRVPNDPPPINQRPWYRYTLRTTTTLSSSSGISFKVDDLRDLLAQDFGYTTTQNFELRLLWARAWARSIKAGTGVNAVSQSAMSFNFHNCDYGNGGEGNPIIKTIEDTGSPITYPKAGYRWLRTAQQTPILTQNNSDSIFTAAVSSGDTYVGITLDVHFLWRIPGALYPHLEAQRWFPENSNSFKAMEDSSDDEQ